MVIVYVGNFTQPFCTEVHIANTLERLGHQVIRLQENTTDQVFRPCDLFLFTRTWGDTVKMEDLNQYREANIPTVSYHLDLYVGLARDGNIDTDPFWRTDFVFTPDGDPHSDEVFKQKGINHVWMKPGVDKAECYLSSEPITKDVIFVGSRGYHPEWPYRSQLVDWLKNNYGDRFEHWGTDGLGVVRNDALNRLYASTKVVVGDSLCLPGHKNYWSDRPYETLGRGGFLIMPNVPGLAREFVDGLHMRMYDYGNFKQLKYFIDKYLKSDEEREFIRRSGHELVKNQYTYDERLTEMLEVLTHEVKK